MPVREAGDADCPACGRALVPRVPSLCGQGAQEKGAEGKDRELDLKRLSSNLKTAAPQHHAWYFRLGESGGVW